MSPESVCELTSLNEEVNRAYGGCLGTNSRRRTYQPAISIGEAARSL